MLETRCPPVSSGRTFAYIHVGSDLRKTVTAYPTEDAMSLAAPTNFTS